MLINGKDDKEITVLNKIERTKTNVVQHFCLSKFKKQLKMKCSKALTIGQDVKQVSG